MNNQRHKLLILAITGDCPALSLMCRFVNHNGYFSCWLCSIRGEHICNKRQYPYEEPILRTVELFERLSVKAEQSKKNIYGHFGRSIIANLLDVPLPKGILVDYLHVTLLGHAKTIIIYIYERMRPAQREQMNVYLKQQKFPRKIFILWFLLFQSLSSMR